MSHFARDRSYFLQAEKSIYQRQVTDSSRLLQRPVCILHSVCIYSNDRKVSPFPASRIIYNFIREEIIKKSK